MSYYTVEDVLEVGDSHYLLAESFREIMESNEGAIFSYTKILIPTDSNDDVNGSQHVSDGGNDFTYRDADWDEIENASSLGFYEYFSNFGDVYTGHYYEGDMNHFCAIVVDPPPYAVEVIVK